MARGKPPSREAHELVLKLATLTPRPTNRAIMSAVRDTMGEAVSERSIARYCEAAGLPTSNRGVALAGAARLVIDYQPEHPGFVGRYRYAEGAIRNVARLSVMNRGRETARSCTATLTFIGPERSWLPLHAALHWGDTNYTLETETAPMIDLAPGARRYLDVGFAPTESPRQAGPSPRVELKAGDSRSAIGTAAVVSAPKSDVAGPQGIGAASLRDVDITAAKSTGDQGGWIAAPLALSRPDLAHHLYLPPGDYQVAVAVSCENGRGQTQVFNLHSPGPGDVPRLSAAVQRKVVEDSPTKPSVEFPQIASKRGSAESA